MDVRTSQGLVFEFLTAEGASPKEIRGRLRSVFGEGATDVSSENGHVVSRAVNPALVTGPAGLQQRVLGDRHTAY